MNTDIPDWNPIGVLPPINEFDPVGFGRSPYKTNTLELVDRFAFNSKRASILSGFLAFRDRLYKTGMSNGFQWIDGSFTENIELTGARKPNDIDVVTFFKVPEGETQQSIMAREINLFHPAHGDWRKKNFLVDAYFQCLDVSPVSLVERSVYWYSMWSHKRDMSWKGFLQVPLSKDDDIQANTLLKQRILGGFSE